MRFISLGSGSKGNSTYIENNGISILIDCGFSKKKMLERASQHNIDLSKLSAIFITHSHSDHIGSLDYFINDLNIKTYGQRETLLSCIDFFESKNKKLNTDNLFPIKIVNHTNDNDLINIHNEIKILPCFSYHDTPCVFYKIFLNDMKFAVLTDCGTYDDYILRVLSDVNILMLECNYDENFLLNNPNYPDSLKRRVRDKYGHMSNVDCANVIMKINNDDLKVVCLSHISQNNNTYDYAIDFVKDFLNKNYKSEIELPTIIEAFQDETTDLLSYI